MKSSLTRVFALSFVFMLLGTFASSVQAQCSRIQANAISLTYAPKILAKNTVSVPNNLSTKVISFACDGNDWFIQMKIMWNGTFNSKYYTLQGALTIENGVWRFKQTGQNGAALGNQIGRAFLEALAEESKKSSTSSTYRRSSSSTYRKPTTTYRKPTTTYRKPTTTTRSSTYSSRSRSKYSTSTSSTKKTYDYVKPVRVINTTGKAISFSVREYGSSQWKSKYVRAKEKMYLYLPNGSSYMTLKISGKDYKVYKNSDYQFGTGTNGLADIFKASTRHFYIYNKHNYTVTFQTRPEGRSTWKTHSIAPGKHLKFGTGSYSSSKSYIKVRGNSREYSVYLGEVYHLNKKTSDGKVHLYH